MRKQCYKLLNSVHKHLHWCKLCCILDKEPEKAFKSLRLEYLGVLARRLRKRNKRYESDREDLLSVAGDFFLCREKAVACYALLNLYADGRKHLSTKKLLAFEKSIPGDCLEKLLANMIAVGNNISKCRYESAILGLKGVIDHVQSNSHLGMKVEMLNFYLATIYLQRSLCEGQSDSEKAEYTNSGLKRMKEYYEIKTATNPLEANYNMARAFHSTGDLANASKYYRRVLEVTVARRLLRQKTICEKGKEESYMQAAAFNLALIYQHDENPRMAQLTLLDNIKF
eukprot:TRINITY_DN2862_c0_g2_i1.p1 TRINITY_DN2862_c0_g2~~TRINITY_DN2862_c0_g2_i1.p1  ORF type:complete len:284 (-),score=45.84 TRINITY_DN2862_c0_g2_i1:61-912(-)